MAENATNKVLTLKQELREAIKLAQELSDTPGPKLDEAILRAGQLKDEISDVNEQIAIFSGGSGFEQAGNALGDIGGKLKNLDFEGAAKSAKALTEITKSITFTQATKGIKDMASTFLNLGKALLTNPLFLIAAAIGLAVAAIVKLLDKMGVLKKIGEVVGWIFEKIGEFLEYIADTVSTVVDAVFGTTLVAEKQAQQLAEQQDKLLESAKRRSQGVTDGLEREIKQQKALGKNTEELEIRKLELIVKTAAVEFKLYQERFKNKIYLAGLDEEEIENQRKLYRESAANLKNAQSDLKVFNNEKIKEKEDANKKDAEADKAANEKARAKAKQNAQDRLQAERTLRDLELANMQDGVEKELAQNTEKYKRLLEDAKKNERLNSEEKKKIVNELLVQEVNSNLKITEENNKKKEELEKAYQNSLKELNKIQAETRLQQLDQDYNAKAEALKKEYTDEVKQAELLKALEAKKQLDISKIKEDEKKRNNEALLQLDATDNETKKVILEEQRVEELSNKDLTEAEKLLIDQRYAEEKKKLDDEELENKKKLETAKLNLAKSGFDLITDLANLFGSSSEKAAKKAFEVNKAVGIAQTIISTYQAAQAAYASQLTVPSPDAPIRGAIAAGIAVASGLVKVAAIAKTQFKSSSVPSAGAGSTPNIPSSNAPATPQFNLFGQGNNANTIGPGSQQQANQNMTVQVNSQVSVSEINAVQNRVAVQEQRSSL